MLPAEIPIFPLPNVVLFPTVFLPLHIFETRYRSMVADALAGDRLIGMALLRPGWEPEYEGRPSVYDVGCAGLITHADRLPDGRYNIVLKGVARYRILDEDRQRSYRVARIDVLSEEQPEDHTTSLREARQRLEALLLHTLKNHDARFPASMADADLVNALAQYLELDPVEKQALLERDGPLDRGHSLLELLEMKLLAARTPRDSNHFH